MFDGLKKRWEKESDQEQRKNVPKTLIYYFFHSHWGRFKFEAKAIFKNEKNRKCFDLSFIVVKSLVKLGTTFSLRITFKSLNLYLTFKYKMKWKLNVITDYYMI
jgi:hypothetical protein